MADNMPTRTLKKSTDPIYLNQNDMAISEAYFAAGFYCGKISPLMLTENERAELRRGIRAELKKAGIDV